MSNQRVVVLTDDLRRAIAAVKSVASRAEDRGDDRTEAQYDQIAERLQAVMEHPGGITNDMVQRALARSRELDESSDEEVATVLEHGDWESHAVRQVLEAALFPDGGLMADSTDERVGVVAAVLRPVIEAKYCDEAAQRVVAALDAWEQEQRSVCGWPVHRDGEELGFCKLIARHKGPCSHVAALAGLTPGHRRRSA